MVPMTYLTLTLTFGGVVVMAAVSPSTRDRLTSVSPTDSSTASFLTSISTAKDAEHITKQNETKHEPINCSDTKSVSEIFTCILEGMLSEPILIGAGIIILLAGLFVILKMVQSKQCRNCRKAVDLNMDEEKKMIA